MALSAEFRAMNREFHKAFKMPHEEKLVCYAYCYCMRNGRLYISLNHLCFYSSICGLETKLCFRYLELIDIKRSGTRITVRTSRGEKYTFSKLSDEQYDVIVQLSKLTAQKWLQDPQWPFVSESSIFGDLNPRFSFNQGLKFLRLESHYRAHFRLPALEILLRKIPGNLKLPDGKVDGMVNLFRSYLCFTNETLILVVPLNMIVLEDFGSVWRIHINSTDILEIQKKEPESKKIIDYINHNTNVASQIASKDRSFLKNLEPLNRSSHNPNRTYEHDPSLLRDTKKYRAGGSVPNHLRHNTWMIHSAAAHWKQINPGLYLQLVKHARCHASKTFENIEKDLDRTVPDDPIFQEDGKGIAILRRVLQAYALLNPDVGYCQGMNFIVAMFSMYCSEEDAFWLLRYVCESLLEDYYKDGLLMERIDQAVLQELIASHLPDLARLDNLDFICTSFTCYFQNLFLAVLPIDKAVCLIDYFLCVGVEAIFIVALEILQRNNKKLLDCRNDGETLQLFDKFYQEIGDNVAKLIQDADRNFAAEVTFETIDKLRNKFRIRTIVEYENQLEYRFLLKYKKNQFFELDDLQLLLSYIKDKKLNVKKPNTKFKFNDTKKKLHLNKEIFREMLVDLTPWAHIAEKLFKLMDEQNYGYLNFDQVALVLGIIGLGTVEEKLKLLCLIHLPLKPALQLTGLPLHELKTRFSIITVPNISESNCKEIWDSLVKIIFNIGSRDNNQLKQLDGEFKTLAKDQFFEHDGQRQMTWIQFHTITTSVEHVYRKFSTALPLKSRLESLQAHDRIFHSRFGCLAYYLNYLWLFWC